VAGGDADRVDDLAVVAREAHRAGMPGGDARVARVERQFEWFGTRPIGTKYSAEIGKHRVGVVDSLEIMRPVAVATEMPRFWSHDVTR
jgi:hypothetical protein